MTSYRPGDGPPRGPGGPPRGGASGGGGQRPLGPRPDDGDTFWRDYLKDGYFDGTGNVRPRLVVEDAIQVASRLAQGRTGGRDGFAPAQLRRFYGKAKFLEQKLEAGYAFPAIMADLRTLQPLAADAVAKDKAPREFKQFIDKNIPLAATDERSFRQGFLAHFQSVVAYFNYEKKR